MKAKAISLWDRAMLSRRYIIETINGQLKNISYIEHSMHRSMKGFMLNSLAGLVAYCLKENKPSLNLTDVELNSMVVAKQISSYLNIKGVEGQKVQMTPFFLTINWRHVLIKSAHSEINWVVLY
jgi:hypothetical protein